MTGPEPGTEERLALVRFLSKLLAKVREQDLLPAAARTLPPGSRIPVAWGGRHAAWVSMPHPSRSAAVTDPAAFLAWAQKHHPGKVRDVETIGPACMDDVLALVAEYLPEAIVRTPTVDPQWTSDIIAGLKGTAGRYVTVDGDALTSVPGIALTVGGLVAKVDFTDDATEIIGAAWQAGEISLDWLMPPALPAAEPGPAPVPAPEREPVPAGAPEPDGAFFDEHGRFRSPELAAIHAVTVQGGFSTPAREARRMIAGAKRGGDLGEAQMAMAWLAGRGLTPDGDDEPDQGWTPAALDIPATSPDCVDVQGEPGIG